MNSIKNRNTTIIAKTTLITLVLCAYYMTFAQAESHASREYHLKAAFLYNFSKFITWPESAFQDKAHPMTICVFDEKLFGNSLKTLKGKMARGRAIVIRKCDTARDAVNCHILFVNHANGKKIRPILKSLKNRPILTVGETRGFANQGGIINFIRDRHMLRLEINTDQARGAGIKISSKLLRMASIVKNVPEKK